jgi:hypothetical protein
MSHDIKQEIINAVDGLVSSFLYYDRKEDEELQVGQIEDSITAGKVTTEEIVDRFKEELLKGLEL